ncbi:MAG: non-canonical purine NTP diphosphatase [Bacteroidaceae bacterium]|nr:non-canonical purine NTP diphosphatase [Bacteroidaceae bacterium]
MKIVFATNNKHKLDEVRNILGEGFEVVSLSEIGCTEDIPETGNTLKENAQQKAEYIYNKYGIPCFADDTGLEVEALNGEPGIYSARYAAINNAGEGHDSEANMAVLLQKLSGKENRKAHFKTVICLIIETAETSETAETLFFEGIVEGEITTVRSGAEGFGYDPIFKPEGYDKTFAELGNDIKNGISHRARAVAKLAAFMKSPRA